MNRFHKHPGKISKLAWPIAAIVSMTSGLLSTPVFAQAGQIEEIVLGNPTIRGTDNPNLKITNDAPSNFELGTTTVTWSVIESNGNSADDVQNITLIDSTKPEIKISSPIEGLQINSNDLIISGISHDEIGVEVIEIIINNEEILKNLLEQMSGLSC